jgi:CDP-diglyceride synthetase
MLYNTIINHVFCAIYIRTFDLTFSWLKRLNGVKLVP